MDEKQLQHLAAQLACPKGVDGAAVSDSMNEANAFITARCMEMLVPAGGERIVEIGPGNGKLSVPLVETLGDNGHYIGLERSEDMAQEADKQLSQVAPGRVEVINLDCMSASIDADSVDGLIAINLLYFIDDLPRFFTQISTWLKPSGRAIFGVRSAQALKQIPFTDYGFHIRPLGEIVKQLKASGFAQVNTRYFDEGVKKLGDIDIPVDTLVVKAIAGATPN